MNRRAFLVGLSGFAAALLPVAAPAALPYFSAPAGVALKSKLQYGDSVIVTDCPNFSRDHALYKQAESLVDLQIEEFAKARGLRVDQLSVERIWLINDGKSDRLNASHLHAWKVML